MNILGLFNITRSGNQAGLMVPQKGQVLASDPFEGGYNQSGGSSPIHTLVERLATTDMDQGTRLFMMHIIRQYISDVQTAFIGRRAIEGELCIKSDDEVLAEELNAFASEIKVGNISGIGCPTGLNLYLDGFADGADEYGLQIGEIDYMGRNIERLRLPDMRSFRIERGKGPLTKLVQMQSGTPREITSGNVQSLAFKGHAGEVWPASMIWGSEFVAEALLRLLISLNTMWWKVGDPPMMYGIEYEAGARLNTKTVSDAAGNAQLVDVNLEALASAIRTVKDARRRGMITEIIMSVHGGKIVAEPVFGNQTTAGIMKDVEPQYRILSGQIAQLAEIPSWLFTSGSNKSEGIGSNRANQEASIAFQAAERRRPRLERIARDILNRWLLSQRQQNRLDKFTLEWTAPSIINEELIQKKRVSQATADQSFIRNSFEMFNQEGEYPLPEEQVQYLVRNGVLEESE